MFVYAMPLKYTFPTVSENTLEIDADCRKIVTLWHGNAFHITGPFQAESVSQHSPPVIQIMMLSMSREEGLLSRLYFHVGVLRK